MAHIFVYGTLKREQPNHHRLFDINNGRADFLALASTIQKYPLVIATIYNIPFLLNLPGQGHSIQGEIYKVDNQMLEYLDEFEGIPTTYQRTLIELKVKEWMGPAEGEEKLSPGNITKAYVYSTTTYQPDWPSLPNYASYDSGGDHGLGYMSREARN